MDLNLSEEEREVREWVRTFVRKEIIPLEPEVLSRERRGEPGQGRRERERLGATGAGEGPHQVEVGAGPALHRLADIDEQGDGERTTYRMVMEQLERLPTGPTRRRDRLAHRDPLPTGADLGPPTAPRRPAVRGRFEPAGQQGQLLGVGVCNRDVLDAAGRKVIEDDALVSTGAQRIHDVAADESGAAGDQYLQLWLSPSLWMAVWTRSDK